MTDRGSPQELRLALLLGVITALSVLAIGSVHRATLAITAVLVAVALWLASKLPRRSAPLFPAPAMVLLLLSLFCVMQAVPLPLSLLSWVAPANADIHARALLPLGAPAPAYASISLDPSASIAEALRWLCYGAMFGASQKLSMRYGYRWAALAAFVAATLVSLATLGHGLLGAKLVYGVYKPTFDVAAWHVAPLLNPNNLAGYLNLGAMCGIGLCLSRRTRLPVAVIWAGVALIMAISLLSASRGGVILLAIGLVGAAARTLHIRRRRQDNWSMRTIAALASTTAIGVTLALLGFTGASYRELFDKNISKLDVAYVTKAMIGDHLWLGVGRGAFESVFSAYRLGKNNIVFTHAENWPAQWASEWGVPVAAAALAALAISMRPAFRSAKSTVGGGAWIGLGLLLVQNFFDLALEVPAVCIAASMLLGALYGDAITAPPSRSGSDRRVRRRRRRLAVAGSALATAALGIASQFGASEVSVERRRLENLYARSDLLKTDQREALVAAISRAMRRQPAEPYFPRLGAIVAHESDAGDPMVWLERALERGMGNGHTHMLLAMVLAKRGYLSQALMELRLSAERAPGLSARIAALALQLARQPADLFAMAPPGPAGVPVLERLAGKLGDPNRRDWRRGVDQEILKRSEAMPQPHFRLGADLVEALSRPSDPLCSDRPVCEAELETHIAKLKALLPDHSQGQQLHARWLAARGNATEALALLRDRCRTATDRGPCLQARANLAAQTGGAELTEASRELLLVACRDRSKCADAHSWIARHYSELDEWALALNHCLEAAKRSPSAPRWRAVAKTASKAGNHARAIDALERLLAMRPKDGRDELERWLASERKKLLRSLPAR